MVAATATPYHVSATERARRAREIPLVCVSCAQVHPITPDDLRETTIQCPACGHERESAAIAKLLPATLRGRG